MTLQITEDEEAALKAIDDALVQYSVAVRGRFEGELDEETHMLAGGVLSLSMVVDGVNAVYGRTFDFDRALDQALAQDPDFGLSMIQAKAYSEGLL